MGRGRAPVGRKGRLRRDGPPLPRREVTGGGVLRLTFAAMAVALYNPFRDEVVGIPNTLDEHRCERPVGGFGLVIHERSM